MIYSKEYIQGLVWEQTNQTYPEEYNVYKKGLQVAYVKLEYGKLRVYCPTRNSRVIMDKRVRRQLYCITPLDKEQISERIYEWIESRTKDLPKVLWHHGKCDMCKERPKRVLHFGYDQQRYEDSFRICNDCLEENNVRDRL